MANSAAIPPAKVAFLKTAAIKRLQETMPPRSLSRLLSEGDSFPFSISTRDGVIGYVDHRYLAICGRSEDEMLGQTHRVVRSDYQSEVVYDHLQEVLARNDVWWGEFCNRTKTGNLFWLEAAVAPVSDGEQTFYFSVYRNNTAGHRSESSLQLHDLVLEQMAEALLIADALSADFAVTYVNDAWTRLTGYASAEIIGHNARILQGESTDPDLLETLRDCLREGRPFRGEILNYRKNGTSFWNDLEIRPVHGAEGVVTHFVATCNDVTERRHFRAQSEFEQMILEKLARGRMLDDVLQSIATSVERQFLGLRCSILLVDRAENCLRPRCAPGLPEEFFRLADGVLVSETNLLFAAAAAGRTVIVPDLRRLPEGAIKEGANRLGFRAAWSVPIAAGNESTVGTIVTYCTSSRGPSDPERQFCEVAARLAAIAIERWLDEDVRTHLERQLRRAQKMEAVGTLAGGIAHDFNNILTGIFGFVQLAREDLPAEHIAHTWLEEVMAAAMRARDVVRQILTFSRQQEQEVSPCDLGSVTQEALKLIRAVLPATVEFKLVPPNELPIVRADPVQVHQAMVNLCTNAWHAMPDGAGKITIEILDTMLPRDGLPLPAELKPGRFVCISVRDNGEGMSPEMLERIFEPFFTTKPPGKGSGLGLSVVHGIMQAQGGGVMVESIKGVGSVFYLAFPAETTVVVEKPPSRPIIVKGSGESLLLVDDEKPIVGWLRALLKRSGYVVEGFVQPIDALAAFEANPDGFDLLLTDLTMPGLTGVDLARRIRKIRPNIPILMMSGYDDIATPDHVLDVGIDEMLRKPLMAETLTSAIHRALEGKPRVNRAHSAN